ncbi:TatD family hydrolase [uncultured Adlercreutzia sp.]|uniref:TatD family hydrolase n=2 Tax=uncultured Adlercreutzia sp. TaxID=875803 RepID=UPI0026374870|nr:TatD family hydrolase [uncultured Adlercreutzia sp.]
MLTGMETLYDMHCHLGFTPDPARTAAEAAARGIGGLSCTVTPAEYEALTPQLATASSMRLALGAHPWWIADGRIDEAQLTTFCALAPGARFIGEIGLDFAGARDTGESRARQLAAFERILAACDEVATDLTALYAFVASDETTPSTALATTAAGNRTAASKATVSANTPLPKLLSIHAVNAAGDVLDALQAAGTLVRHQVIFHWFSGSSDDLQRALRAGCFFSVGPRMLASRRGREYARQIPFDRLLLETDMPARAGEPLPAEIWEAELRNALAGIAQLKDVDPTTLAQRLAATSEALLTPADSTS